MVKRTIEISRDPSHLCVRDEQMIVLRRTEAVKPIPAAPPNLAGVVPIEDIGVLMVDERDTTYTHTLLAKLAEHGAALVVCGRDHHPCGMFLPLNTNTQLLARLDAQIDISKPKRKNLWRQIVQAKLRAQAANTADQTVRARLLELARRVRSGDPDNSEAVGAAAYWPALFRDCGLPSGPFRRRPGERDAPAPNNLLDYGYAALRATVARAIVSAGLLPALGIKHIGRGNPFCLADDLMEPMRPIIDARVKYLARRGDLVLAQPVKAELLNVLAEPVICGSGEGRMSGPLMVAITRSVASFVRVLTGEAERAEFPILPQWSERIQTESESVEEDESTATDSPDEEGDQA